MEIFWVIIWCFVFFWCSSFCIVYLNNFVCCKEIIGFLKKFVLLKLNYNGGRNNKKRGVEVRVFRVYSNSIRFFVGVLIVL